MSIRTSTDLDVLSVTPEPFDHLLHKTAFLCVEPAEPRVFITEAVSETGRWPWVAKFSADVNGASLARRLRSMPFLTALNAFCDQPSAAGLTSLEQALKGIESTTPNLLMQWMQDNVIRIDALGDLVPKGEETGEDHFYVLGAGVLHGQSSDRELASLVERVSDFMAGSDHAHADSVCNYFEQLRDELRAARPKSIAEVEDEADEDLQMALL